MPDTSPYAERLAAAIKSHVDGPLGPRRATDLVARLKSLLDEARMDGEPWSRISDALSDELLRLGRPPISEGTLRRLWQRLSKRPGHARASSATAARRDARLAELSLPSPSKPRPSSVVDLNYRSADRDRLGSQTQAERLALMRGLREEGDL